MACRFHFNKDETTSPAASLRWRSCATPLYGNKIAWLTLKTICQSLPWTRIRIVLLNAYFLLWDLRKGRNESYGTFARLQFGNSPHLSKVPTHGPKKHPETPNMQQCIFVDLINSVGVDVLRFARLPVLPENVRNSMCLCLRIQRIKNKTGVLCQTT